MILNYILLGCSCCFANLNLLLLCRSRCHRRRRCLSSLVQRGGGGRGGEAHLPLNHTLNPTQIIQNNLCVVRWHKQTSQQSSQYRSRLCHGIVKYIFKSVFRHQNVGNFCLGRGGPRIPLPKLFLKNDSLTQSSTVHPLHT